MSCWEQAEASDENSKREEDALVARAQAGDSEALASLFTMWRKPLFAFVYRMVTRREDAEDLSQEVVVRALRGLASFRRDSRFKTWLFGIATHVCLDYLRNKQRWRVEAQMLAQQQGTKSSAHNQKLARVMSDPGFTFDIKEHITFCLACIGRTLEPDAQAALLLRDMFGFTAQESAQILQVSEPVLRHRLAQARSTMAAHFDGLCQLINKTGVCYQCRGLRDFCSEEHKGTDLVTIDVLPGVAKTPETLLQARLLIAKSADLEDGNSSRLHTLFFEWLTRQEGGVR
jgi:RNA polymerase sigma-70 factor, ECF subfamily